MWRVPVWGCRFGQSAAQCGECQFGRGSYLFINGSAKFIAQARHTFLQSRANTARDGPHLLMETAVYLRALTAVQEGVAANHVFVYLRALTALQEGVAANHVFVFAWKAGQHPYTHSAEVKSILEKTTRNSSKLHIYLQKPRGAQRSATERVIRYGALLDRII